MNRREFVGASLAGFIAALALSFEPFVTWWRQWLGEPRLARETGKLTAKTFNEALKKLYPKEKVERIAFSPPPGFAGVMA